MDRTIRDQGIVDPDKSFLTELVYGTLRQRGNLDWIIGQFIQPRRLKRLRSELIEVLRLGLYQLLFLDGVPDHAAVNEAVELSKKYGYKGVSRLVNAVLRGAARSKEKISYPDINLDPIKHISARYSHPEWLVERWIERYGINETIQLCSANNLRAPLYIRTNFLKVSRDQLMRSLHEEGVEAMAGFNLPESIKLTNIHSPLNQLSSYKSGLFQVQDESSMLASYILNPQPSQTIIDICAAPGGKSTHIAEMMQNKGNIWAFDVDSHRLPLIWENCRRLGITILEAIEADARKLNDYISEEKADGVLVDVPCTSLGALRRHVETRWRRTPDDLKIFPELQYAILDNAAHYVKTGGVLVYCTCTIEPEENQHVVEKFLRAHPQFQIQNVLPFLPDQLQKLKHPVSAEGYMQTYPHLHDMDGFFAARMVKHDS